MKLVVTSPKIDNLVSILFTVADSKSHGTSALPTATARVTMTTVALPTATARVTMTTVNVTTATTDTIALSSGIQTLQEITERSKLHRRITTLLCVSLFTVYSFDDS